MKKRIQKIKIKLFALLAVAASKSFVANAVFLTGLLTIATGIYLMHPPIAVIALGLIICLIGYSILKG